MYHQNTFVKNFFQWLHGTFPSHFHPEYIVLINTLSRMYQSLSNVKANPSKHALSNELEITINDKTSCPTHMLAVYCSTSQPNQPCQVTMYPTHSLILASHCADLPVLPPSCPSSSTPTTATVPVVCLSLPSPPTFPLLHCYLYTKDAAHLSSALLSPSEPMRQVALVSGVWSNAYALGVVDDNLYTVLDKAWELVSTKLENASS